MDSYAIAITILACLCILVVVYLIVKRIKEEHFADDACTFRYTTGDSHINCLNKCYKTDNCKETCESSCEEAQDKNDPCVHDDGTTICNINSVTDINGETQANCVENCTKNTEGCTGCSEFKIFDPITGRYVEGTYTDGNDGVAALDDFKNKCDSSAENRKYCNPCAKACYYCSNPDKCEWLPGSTRNEVNKNKRRNFKKAGFTISVIPDDGKATIVWTENSEDVANYKIFIYKKADVNLNDSGQQTPLTVRTETKNGGAKGDHISHTIDTLVNGETYSINVNKVSKDFGASSGNGASSGDDDSIKSGPVIISSNTIDIIPSRVTLVNFSGLNRDNTLKQRDLLSVGLLKELTGKTFDISL
tara:strand:+ start:1009 stop:2091 length:1083 start_codon:yes stop_codon:yes gene_type:complete